MISALIKTDFNKSIICWKLKDTSSLFSKRQLNWIASFVERKQWQNWINCENVKPPEINIMETHKVRNKRTQSGHYTCTNYDTELCSVSLFKLCSISCSLFVLTSGYNNRVHHKYKLNLFCQWCLANNCLSDQCGWSI